MRELEATRGRLITMEVTKTLTLTLTLIGLITVEAKADKGELEREVMGQQLSSSRGRMNEIQNELEAIKR